MFFSRTRTIIQILSCVFFKKKENPSCKIRGRGSNNRPPEASMAVTLTCALLILYLSGYHNPYNLFFVDHNPSNTNFMSGNHSISNSVHFAKKNRNKRIIDLLGCPRTLFYCIPWSYQSPRGKRLSYM